MKSKILLLLLSVAALVGCRSPGPYERSFRPTSSAPAATPDPVLVGVPSGSLPLNLTAEEEAEEEFQIPEDPVLPENAVLAYELVEAGDITNWWAKGYAEIGRSTFVGPLADRTEAVEVASRLGAPVVVFHAADLGEQLVWRTEYEERLVLDPWPPPPHGRHRRHGYGPPPPHHHFETVPVERLRPMRLFAQTAVYLRPDKFESPAPPPDQSP